MQRSKTTVNNLIYIALAILAIGIYFLVDGLQMFKNDYYVSHDMLSALNENISHVPDSEYNALKYHIASLINLTVILFPVTFAGLRFHISFKKTQDSEKTDVRWLISIARPVLGLLAFYYILTLGTVFSHEIFTDFYALNSWYGYLRIFLAFLVLSASVIDWPRFIKAIKNMPQAHPLIAKTLFVSGISVISCCLLEFQTGSKMNFMSTMLLFNIMYWLLLQILIDLVSPSVRIGAGVSLILAFVIGLVNDVVYQFRGNYVLFGDITVVKTALEVAGGYVYKPGIWFFISLALLIISFALVIFLRFPDEQGRSKKGIRPKEIIIRAVAVELLIGGIVVSFTTGLLYNYIFGIGWDYNENIKNAGYIPYFLSNMSSINSVECEGYTPEAASLAIEDALRDEETGDNDSYVMPNIIIIQNEAFSDLAVAYDIETDQDYMPFIHSLTENTLKGYLNMSITGGPTANTEFEVLTQTSLQFMPYGSVPYTQYTNHEIPTVATMLESQDIPYHTVAYHSYYSSGYKREGVYSYFGFDEARFEDSFLTDYPESDMIRHILSDEADYRVVEEMFEDYRTVSSDPWFCFNVTIQGHGGYTEDMTFEDPVTVTNFDAAQSINTYLSLIKISDTAFMHLTEYFEKVDEPTVIIMYGDHQPSFDEEASEDLAAHPADHETGDQSLYSYYVPYVIWANYDIPEEDFMGQSASEGTYNTLSTNYLVSYALGAAGMRLPDYDRYLLRLHETVPAVTAIGVWDSNGDYYPDAARSSEADLLKGLEYVQYNRIFDKENILFAHYLLN